MKKSIVKRIGSLLTVLLLTASIFSNGLVAFAADTKHTQSKVLDWSYNFEGSGLKNAYDPLTGGNTNDAFRYKWAQEFYFWNDESGNNCYCVQLGTEHDNNIVMSSSTFDDEGIKKYYKDVDQRKNLKVATIFAYKGKTKYGYNADTERVASQAMIWTVSGGFFDSSSENLSSDENTILNRIYAPSSADHKNLVDCYKKMKGDILNYYKIPAGTTTAVRTAPTYELKYNTSTKKYEGTIKADSSISQFDFSKVDGVTFKKDGSNIKVSANENIKAGTKTVTLTKARAKNSGKIEECVPLFYKGKNDSGSQAKVGYMSGKDPVQAYIKLKISTGSAHLDKSFTDYFDNKQTGTADMYKAVKFQLACKVGDGYKFVKASGSDGSYSFTDLASQATDLTPNGKGDIDVTGLPEGSYEWREISTADGYMLSSKKAITVAADKTATTEFVNKRNAPDKGKITIHKRDAETRADLAGAKFEVAAAEDIYVGNGYCICPKGTVIDTITTGADGIAETTKAIYKGYSYTVTEIEAPKGYSISDEPTQTIKLVEQQAEFVVDFDNEIITKPFEITKTDISTGELIPDCTFEILNENKEQVITGTTDENGIAHFQLAIGKYFYREISAPDIYEIDDTPYPFEITENDDIVKAEMTNKKKSGSIKVTKTTTGNLNIEGIKFFATGISDTNKDLKFEATTNENGVAMFDKLVIGKYVITEDGSTVPAAYLTADEQEVTVEYNETAEVAFENIEKTGEIKVTKTTVGNINVSGITFNLRGTSDSGRDIDIPAVTDENGVAIFSEIPIGTYTIYEDEKTVPTAYLVADPQNVTVTYAETKEVPIENKEKSGSIVVHKTTEGQKNIEGIKFYLRGTSDTGREIDIPATTDKDGIAKFENIPIGTYKVTEDKETVPYGYLVADEKEVKVEYAQTIDETILNAEQTGTVQVHKKTDGMTNIEGIRFILSGISDTGREINIPAITDKDGIAKFENVPIGTYTITEDGSTVPYGYLVADSKQVTVAYAQTVDTDMVNEKAPDTPNTGVMDNDSDGRTALCSVAIILAGAAVLMFSRKKKER
ncbi:SpaA isopeptide-forming pilin-related protein [Ruminococcus bicirculans (ex Wegman et al. 2014)]|uniref:SpaA isopeptide-forming pilin-related protein n=1 Tax=Ruminococcus bicirculans (ex Wegman et al. 2014) TaxID=1160721 RepID=UPI003FD88D43